MNLKKIFSALTAISIIGCMQSGVFGSGINDFEKINRVKSLDIMKGYDDGSFGEENSLTRAEFAAVICRILNSDNTLYSSSEKIYTDVPEEHWAFKNINLVTAGHFLKQILPVLKKAKNDGINIPFVYNTSSYEAVEQIKALDNVVDIYLPDLKYISSELSQNFSSAEDYFDIASAAIDEMVRQKGKCVFDESGKMISGVIVRHLVLPKHIGEAKRIIRYLHTRYGNDIYISIMSQYTPLLKTCKYPELLRRVKKDEYDRVIDYAEKIGVKNAFIQCGAAAEESFIPQFDCEGV